MFMIFGSSKNNNELFKSILHSYNLFNVVMDERKTCPVTNMPWHENGLKTTSRHVERL